jgi:DNA-binding NtrC family response regulator
MSVQPSAATPPGVLVADNNDYVRAMLGVALRQAGFTPHLAGDGREAVGLFLRHKDEVRVVLLDVNMQRLDGPGALAQIRQTAPQVRCCFMSGGGGLREALRPR